jgi:hypothetical protein
MKNYMNKCVKTITILFLLFICQSALAQQTEMADTFRSEGKIYVVVAIILAILIGFIAYLFLLDKKMTKIERMLSDKNQTK